MTTKTKDTQRTITVPDYTLELPKLKAFLGCLKEAGVSRHYAACPLGIGPKGFQCKGLDAVVTHGDPDGAVGIDPGHAKELSGALAMWDTLDVAVRTEALEFGDSLGSLHGQVPTLPYEEVEDQEVDVAHVLDITDQWNTLLALVPFTMQDYHRPVLACICMEIGDEGLKMVATDTHRLAIAGTPSGPSPRMVHLPRQAILVMKNWLAKVPRDVSVRLLLRTTKEAVQLVLMCQGWRLTVSCKRIQSTYPDWRRVVPTVGDAWYKGTGADMERMAKPFLRFMRMYLDPSDKDAFRVNGSIEEMHLEVERFGRCKDAKTFAVNPRYWTSIAKLFGPDAVVTVTGTEGYRPLVFTAEGTETQAVLMPMALDRNQDQK